MTPCETCRPLLADHAFGLLDAQQASAVDAHLPACTGCQSAARSAQQFAALTKAASSADFPVTAFAPPAVPSAREPALDPRLTVVRWAVAASLLLGAAALVPAAAEGVAAREAARELAYARAEADARSAEANDADAAVRAQQLAIRARRAEAGAALDRLADEWVLAELGADCAVTGPASAVAGAPNVYRVDPPRPGRVLVTDARGATAFAGALDAQGRVTLPSSLWAGGAAPERLSVEAGGRELFARSLAQPAFLTHLSADRATYRPGETVLARAVTLDARSLRPPAGGSAVWFDLVGPRGVVPGLGRLAQSTPAGEAGEPIVGPDGRPVRGVATAAIELPGTLAAGDYQLRVAPADRGGPAAKAVPTTLPVAVARTARPAFDAAVRFAAAGFGPGQEVAGTLTLTRHGKPLAGATATLHADAVVAGDKRQVLSKQPLRVDAGGVAAFRFTLPLLTDGDLASARMTVSIAAGGVNETVRRAVPVRSDVVWVELFPEGGELVAGVPGRVYVRATAASGAPAVVAGVLLDGDREVARFATLAQGLGAFELVPTLGAQYAVRLDAPARAAALEPPAVAGGGVGLRVEPAVVADGQPLKLTLTSAGRARAVVVTAVSRGVLLARAKVELRPGAQTPITLDLQPGGGGVVRVTAFEVEEAGLKPVAERLAFGRPARSLTLTATPDAAPRAGQSVALELGSATEAGSPAGAVLLAAVTAESGGGTGPSLPGHFLLGGELDRPDALESTDVYLTDAPGAAAALDRLLATQGWRRFAEQSAEAGGHALALAAAGATPAELVGTADAAFAERARRLERESAEASVATPPAAVLDRARAADAALRGVALRVESSRQRLATQAAQTAARAGWWPAGVTAAFALAFGLLGAARLVESRADRRWLLAAAAGFALLGGLGTALGVAAPRDDAGPAGPPVDNPDRGPIWTKLVAPRLADAGVLAILTPAPRDDAPERPKSLLSKPWRPGPAAREPADRFGPIRAGGAPAGPRSAVEALFGDGAALPPGVGLELPARLAREADPARAAAARRVAARLVLPVAQRVREYAHANPAGTPAEPPETLLWMPCVVTDAAGKAVVRFDLPPGAATYRVTLAGHTPDGRLGAATTRLVAVGE